MPREKTSTTNEDTSENGKGSYWMLDPSASDMFDAGNYRRRRTRRQRHAKMLLNGQFHQGSAFSLYPEIMQSAHLQHVPRFSSNNLEARTHSVTNPTVDFDDSENSDNDNAVAENHDETVKPISHSALDESDATKFNITDTAIAVDYLSNLDKLLKNQFLQQIHFQSTINDSRCIINHNQLNTNLTPSESDGKMNLKSTNFTIENLIRK